jgi:hypothetical protein
MSIKGFKSQQALQQKLKGYTEDQSIDYARYVTMQELSGRRHALDVLIHGVFEVTIIPLTADVGSNIRVIKCTGHGANAHDLIRLSNGTEFSVLSVPDADTIITSVELIVDPTGDTFTIWRHITPSYNTDGSLNVSLSAGTAIAGSVMPAGGVGMIGWLSAIYTKLIGTLAVTGTFWQASQPVSIASMPSTPVTGTFWQATQPVSGTVTALAPAQAGAFDEDLTVSVAPETFTAPFGAFGCFIEADDTNATNIRVKMGDTASVTSGIQFQAGRSEFYQGGSNISYCTESGTGKLSVQWFVR